MIQKTTFIIRDGWKFVELSDLFAHGLVFSNHLPSQVKRSVADTFFKRALTLSGSAGTQHHYCASHSTTMDCIKMQDALRRRGRSVHFNSINHFFHLSSAGRERFHQGFKNNFGGWTALHQFLLRNQEQSGAAWLASLCRDGGLMRYKWVFWWSFKNVYSFPPSPSQLPMEE